MKESNNIYSRTIEQLEIERLFASPVSLYDDDGELIPRSAISEIQQAKALQKFKEINNAPDHKAMVLKCNMKDRIFTRVKKMTMPYFFTITMSDKTLNEKDFKRVIRRTLKAIGIEKYVLITDYGEENGRLHYHGYLDMVGIKENEMKYTPTKKYPTGISLNKFTKNIGWNLGTPIYGGKQTLNKTIAYTLKYIVKDNEYNFKHSMFCSREQKTDLYNDLPF